MECSSVETRIRILKTKKFLKGGEKYRMTRKKNTKIKKRRYHLALPEDLYLKIQKIADENGTTFIDLLRRFAKRGVADIENGKMEV
ncbi:hypothetical protein ACFL1O_00560 [Patescibacteria group bacterium]